MACKSVLSLFTRKPFGVSYCQLSTMCRRRTVFWGVYLPTVNCTLNSNVIDRLWELKVRHLWNRTRHAATVDPKTPETVEEGEAEELRLRYVYVQTSMGRWGDFPYGLVYDVAYLDSDPGAEYTPTKPTVLALHSTPGCHLDLMPLLRPLAKLGYRVLAPNFPGFGYTEGMNIDTNDVFMHSSEEKAEFVLDFLNNLGIKRVDCVISLGSGSYPALLLCTMSNLLLKFSSIFLVNPWPLQHFRLLEPRWYYRLVTTLWDRPFIRPFTRLFIWLSKGYLGWKAASTYTVIAVAYTLVSLDLSEVSGQATTLSKPLMTVLAEGDLVLSPEHAQHLLETLKIPPSAQLQIASTGSLTGSASLIGTRPCWIRFRTESNDSTFMTRHGSTISALLVRFVENVYKNPAGVR